MTKDIVISRTKFLFIVFGLLIMWGLALHQYLLFLRAYVSPQKAVALYIDVYHEADPEIIMLTISMIVGTFATFYILWFLRGLKKDEYTVRGEK
jgi:hypothetical protein